MARDFTLILCALQQDERQEEEMRQLQGQHTPKVLALLIFASAACCVSYGFLTMYRVATPIDILCAVGLDVC